MFSEISLAAVAVCAASAMGEYVHKVPAGGSLEAARAAVRASGRLGKEPVTVLIALGEYMMSKTLILDAKDGGTRAAPVVWRAEKPGAVKLRGGATIPASRFAPLGDAEKARFVPSAQSRIRVADVSAELPGELKPWPDAYRGMPPAPWLYQDGEPLEIARWPDKDWTSFTNVVDSGLTSDPKNEFADRPGTFYLEGAPNAHLWNLDEGVWTDGYWKHDWDEEIMRLAAYDPVKQTATHRKIHKWGLLGKGTCGMKGRRFKVVNVAAELDSPGEWWLDRAKKRLYFMPVPGKEAMPVVLAAGAPTFVRFDGVSGISFEDVDFEYSHGSAPGAVVAAKSSHVTLRGCSFENFGGVALSIDGMDNLVTGCRFAKIGSSAVTIAGGDRRNILNGCNMLEKSDVSRFGRFSRTACGVRVGGCGNAVRNCEIHHGAAQSLCFGGNEHLFADNDFHHVLLEACDAGAVYSGYDTSSLGNLLFANFTHELGDDPKFWPYRNGFYFDDCDWGDAAIGNRFLHTGPALFIGGGNMHSFHNNLVVDALTALHIDNRGWDWERRLKGSFLADKAGHSWAEQKLMPFNYREAPWHVAYPEAAVLVDDRPKIPHSNPVTGNLFVNCRRPYSLGARARACLAEMPVKDNVNLFGVDEAAFTRPPQPISFTNAVATTVKSPDGVLSATFALDVAGRYSWTLSSNGVELVSRSCLGVTVGYRDFGKFVVPDTAKRRSNVAEAPVKDVLDEGDYAVKLVAKSYNEVVVPLRDLVDARVVAYLEVRAFDGGVAFRWRVPGKGRRKVYGELTTWTMIKPDAVKIHDAERGTQPRYRLQPRGAGARGPVFQDAPRGWFVDGEVVTPWRVTVW